ncbi:MULTISPECIES: hypothetical protein [Methylobacterium]|uniref:hypothetical protein n=1 Tax=Methylobacterium TaxID=407 RepID=UPI0008E4E2B9|nr:MULTISPECIES: hypothetical protein [Methylobacterium]MBZ6412027.1 hypothetical protein [Methylobacterium sp.]MBK3395893.1 hypothetical protein [Methylobacterium ajmalii]MBK3409364.1 hypothetical protein [Methylobacterium ajmalii]MBK3424061.1 hypothetical protein [Methylobacterium ajmalii]SFF14415.1 hypothetical protein SAMN04487844_110155 [Methylobacterium sp. yr596]
MAIARDLQAREPDSATCLTGKHEAMLLDAVAGTGFDLWRLDSGGPTRSSYDVTQAQRPARHRRLDRRPAALHAHPDAERLAHRIDLDTGAVFDGPLTAGVFTAGQGPPVDILSLRWEAGSGIAALDPLPMSGRSACRLLRRRPWHFATKRMPVVADNAAK